MKLSRIGLTTGMMALATAALALPTFFKDFQTTYSIKKGSALDNASCTVCHIGKSPKLNPYGEDLKKLMGAEKVKKLSAEIHKKAEGLDSDKDGVKNIDEIKADTLPGDPKSKK